MGSTCGSMSAKNENNPALFDVTKVRFKPCSELHRTNLRQAEWKRRNSEVHQSKTIDVGFRQAADAPKLIEVASLYSRTAGPD